MSHASRRPIAIELFAGCGGLSLGLEQAGFDVVAAVDVDPVHCASHEFNFPRCTTVCRSVADMKGTELLSLAGLKPGEVDLVSGGAPCQGFSMIGKRALDDPRNALVGHFCRMVSEIRPRYFVFENVKGLTVGTHRKFLLEIIETLEDAGYDVVRDYRVLNAADYGVPQDRRRLFLMGCRRGLARPSYPAPACRPRGPRAPGGPLDGLPLGPSVMDAIGDLPVIEDFGALVSTDKTRARFGKPSAYAAVLRGEAREPDDFSHPREHDRAMLTCSLRTEHNAVSIRRFAATPGGETEPVSRFHKLAADGICNTIRAGTASDHGAFTSPRPIHPVHPRCITNREALRLHSYPDWFRVHMTKWHGFRQIGNSVPPKLARAVGAAIIAAMGVKPRRPKSTLALGDEALLSLSMSDAAKRYGVPSDVIPKRTRTSGRT